MHTRTAHAVILTTTLILTSCGGDTSQGPEPWSLDPSRSLVEQVGYNSYDPRLMGEAHWPGAVGTCQMYAVSQPGAGPDDGQRPSHTIERGRFGVTRSASYSAELCDEVPCVQSERVITYNARGLVEHVHGRFQHPPVDSDRPTEEDVIEHRYTWTDDGLLSTMMSSHQSNGVLYGHYTLTFTYTSGRLSQIDSEDHLSSVIHAPNRLLRYELSDGDLKQLQRAGGEPVGSPHEEALNTWDDVGTMKSTSVSFECGCTLTRSPAGDEVRAESTLCDLPPDVPQRQFVVQLTKTPNSLVRVHEERLFLNKPDIAQLNRQKTTYTADAQGVIREIAWETESFVEGQLASQSAKWSALVGDACPRLQLPEASVNPYDFNVLPTTYQN